MKGCSVTIKGVFKSFGTVPILRNINLEINKGEFFSLLGPSGCGKTTLLRCIAGFETPTQGAVLLSDSDVTAIPPNQRPVNTVFQSYALFPHLSVFDNVAFPLRIKNLDVNTIKAKVDSYIELVKLTDHINKMPSQLSGGQRQRVAIARALINEPQVLLLDEPLSALDAKLRHQLLVDLDSLHDEVGITFIYVTHDQQEALGVSDRIAVMNQGEILQVGSAFEIYDQPANAFVAQFIGETNLFTGHVSAINGPNITVNTQQAGILQLVSTKPIAVTDEITLSLRPEKILLHHVPPNDINCLVYQGRVEEIVYAGYQSRIYVDIGGYIIKVQQPHVVGAVSDHFSWKETVYVSWDPASCYLVEVAKA